jgi:hypothetical protein
MAMLFACAFNSQIETKGCQNLHFQVSISYLLEELKPSNLKSFPPGQHPPYGTACAGLSRNRGVTAPGRRDSHGGWRCTARTIYVQKRDSELQSICKEPQPQDFTNNFL